MCIVYIKLYELNPRGNLFELNPVGNETAQVDNRSSQKQTITIHEPLNKMLNQLKNKQKVREMEENKKRAIKELHDYHKRK